MVWYSGVVRNDTASVARGMGRYAHHCGTALGWETLISLSWTLSTSQKYHHFKHHRQHWNCIKFILLIKIEARNESILGFNIFLIISTISFNSLSYEKFSAGNKEWGGEKLCWICCQRGNIISLKRGNIISLKRGNIISLKMKHKQQSNAFCVAEII